MGRFYRDSGWVRLWNANPSLMDPDLGRVPRGSAGPMSGTELLQPGAILQLGPVYRVKYGDTLTSIAGRSTRIHAYTHTTPAVRMVEPACCSLCTFLRSSSLPLARLYGRLSPCLRSLNGHRLSAPLPSPLFHLPRRSPLTGTHTSPLTHTMSPKETLRRPCP
jgi:hypothetical protein